jgi:hypothetical protein
MSKTKYRLKNIADTTVYYTGKFAVTPIVAVVDTTVAAGQATVGLTKTLGSAAKHIVKAPIAGFIRGNELYKHRFAQAHQMRLDRNNKLASGEYVEVLVTADADTEFDV